jgi:hypothetical protein
MNNAEETPIVVLTSMLDFKLLCWSSEACFAPWAESNGIGGGIPIDPQKIA